jgi:putative transposase
MARPPRLEYPRALYHVTARGNDRGAVFRDDRDRQEYLERIDRSRTRFGFQLLAYCLMTNHLHLAIRTGDQPLSRIMAGTQSSFAQWFNRRHGRVGHFFQGRYKAFLVQEQRYFAALLRYIHMNPVKARIVERPQDYPWSSDRLFRGISTSRFHDRDAALALLGPTPRSASRAYLALMEGDNAPDYARLKETAHAVKGDEEFAIDRIAPESPQPILRGLTEERVVAAVAEVTGIPADILRSGARGGQVATARFLAGYVGKRLGGISLAAMARHLGREASYLLRGVSELEQAVGPDQRSAQLDTIVQRLRSAKSGFRV